MAVDKSYRGIGAGRQLGEAAIRRARAMGATKLILYSETSLATAIILYRKLGFKEIPLEAGTYERANIKMELRLYVEGAASHSEIKEFSNK